MNNQKSGIIFSVIVILQGFLSACQPVDSLPRGTDYSCDLTQNPPATIARTSKGDIPVIRWKSTFFEGSGYTPENRCMEVSERFQTYYQTGLLHYLTTGVQNNQDIICVTRTNGGNCSGLLLTLEPGDDPEQVLNDLVDPNVRTIERSERTGGKLYIELIPELKSP
ncbi:COP23 domain-containing protein [Phormidium pseudopriestleyi FRX01]|uniref:COP23 domain-containing protein n=1 Tax=Phormidium pseudopriestleyi FRX01 TaxID=1759528 RepID=A0ABS3FZ14_9CYAN|nr:COP23 domain-containing protein [Phormidium pseudopriestleyi]MBO0351983.1 COP23 domain-containing protein [Phormidium pseudopriestleyi FRX01]